MFSRCDLSYRILLGQKPNSEGLKQKQGICWLLDLRRLNGLALGLAGSRDSNVIETISLYLLSWLGSQEAFFLLDGRMAASSSQNGRPP